MNKQTFLNALAFAALMVIASSCSSKKEGAEVHDHEHSAESSAADAWKEMDEFHMVMAESFHPYKDSANLEPAKSKAAEMASSAAKWAGSPLPEKVNNEEVKSKLDQLKNGTAEFAEQVRSGDDEAIGESLTALHDLFHELQETWYGGGHHHH
jgi:hypothetical protein